MESFAVGWDYIGLLRTVCRASPGLKTISFHKKNYIIPTDLRLFVKLRKEPVGKMKYTLNRDERMDGWIHVYSIGFFFYFFLGNIIIRQPETSNEVRCSFVTG